MRRVQFWQTKNRWRLDRSFRRGSCCNISCLVDSAALRSVVPPAIFVITKSVTIRDQADAEPSADRIPTRARLRMGAGYLTPCLRELQFGLEPVVLVLALFAATIFI